jgi:molybdopterin converting factor small subunit
MNVRIKLFAAARELAQSDELPVDVASPATLRDIRLAALDACPALSAILPHCLWAVDARYASEDHTVTPDSEIALIPPVSGG